MSPNIDIQKDDITKAFYAAVGAPVVAGRKTKDFGTDVVEAKPWTDIAGTGTKVRTYGKNLFMETSYDDLEAAGREITGAIKDSKVVEQIETGFEQIQDSKVIEQIETGIEQVKDSKVVEQIETGMEQIQEKVDLDQFQDKVEMLREQLETVLHNWREQFTPGVAAPVKVEVEKEAPKKAAPKKTTAKKPAAKKTTAKKPAAKPAAKKTTAKKPAAKPAAKKTTTTK
ncbi:MAG: hypothetical protein ABFS21_07370 [Actinomycetota bacterium]